MRAFHSCLKNPEVDLCSGVTGFTQDNLDLVSLCAAGLCFPLCYFCSESSFRRWSLAAHGLRPTVWKLQGSESQVGLALTAGAMSPAHSQNHCYPRRTRWYRPGLGSTSALGPQGLMQMCRLLYKGNSRCYSQKKGYQVGKKGQTSTKSGVHSDVSSPLNSFTVCSLGFYWNISSMRTEAFPVLFIKYSSWLCVQL